MDFNKPFGERMEDNNDKNDYNDNNNGEPQKGFFESMKESFSTTFNDLKNKDVSASANEFMESNTIVTKFVFLILVLIGFLILVNLGINLLMYFLLDSPDPYVVKGLINGNSQKTVYQDPNNSNSITIYRSNNEDKGMEFTWSVWLKRTDNNNTNDLDHIFNKGSTLTTETNDILINGPGVYFMNDLGANNNQNKILIKMDTVVGKTSGIVTKELIINDLPFKKWFHLAIRLENKIMDIYVNGEIVKREAFEHVPKQNYGNVNVCHNKGFSGNLSDLRYFSKALNVFEITNIVNKGPNLSSGDSDNNTYDYLANIWYTQNNYN